MKLVDYKIILNYLIQFRYLSTKKIYIELHDILMFPCKRNSGNFFWNNFLSCNQTKENKSVPQEKMGRKSCVGPS